MLLSVSIYSTAKYLQITTSIIAYLATLIERLHALLAVFILLPGPAEFFAWK
jgi:hypothetical protein